MMKCLTERERERVHELQSDLICRDQFLKILITRERRERENKREERERDHRVLSLVLSNLIKLLP